jgi:cytochrome c oxidase subunit 1
MLGHLGRQCQVTGLHVDRHAERLFKLHAVTAVVYLAVGGTMALLIALTRWPAVHLIDNPDWFYRLVSAHGTIMLILWILFFEMAGLIFGGTVLLSLPLRGARFGWLAYLMMLGGSIAIVATMLSGQATVMFTAYPPLRATHWFYLAVLIFAVGALIQVLLFIANLVIARLRGEVGTLPLFTFGLLVAAILAVWSILSGAAAVLPAWLWSVGVLDSVDPGVYRLLFWGLGHGAQQVNLAAMVAIWYGLASLTVGARPLNEGLSRTAFLLYVAFIQMGAMHHLIVDPGLGNWVRGFNVSYFVYAAVLGSMIHAFTIPASVEVAQRARGYARGLMGWLRNAPWREPGFSALAISFAMFGILGGISGVIMGGNQSNMIAHNTLIVPAHFHMTVVAGTSLAFMGISYYVVPLMFRRDLLLVSWTRWQPYVYGIGMFVFGIGMGLAGHAGVPRRHFDITFPNVPLSIGPFDSPDVDMWLTMTAIGAMIAVVGGAIYVLSMVGTVFLARQSDTPTIPAVAALALAPPAAPEPPRVHAPGAFEAPGTLALAATWLGLFVLLYGYSWYELSKVTWIIR